MHKQALDTGVASAFPSQLLDGQTAFRRILGYIRKEGHAWVVEHRGTVVADVLKQLSRGRFMGLDCMEDLGDLNQILEQWWAETAQVAVQPFVCGDIVHGNTSNTRRSAELAFWLGRVDGQLADSPLGSGSGEVGSRAQVHDLGFERHIGGIGMFLPE